MHKEQRVSLLFAVRKQSGSDCQEVSFILRIWESDAIFLQCFNTSRISFLMFDKCIKKFRDRKFLFKRVFIFRRNQVFNIVPVFSTHALDKVFKRF